MVWPQQRLVLRPEPHGQGWLRPGPGIAVSCQSRLVARLSSGSVRTVRFRPARLRGFVLLSEWFAGLAGGVMLTLVKASRWSRCGTRCCRSRCASCPTIWRGWIGCSSDPALLGPVEAALGAFGARAWPAVDRDRDVRAVDGGQAPHRLGLRDAGPGGFGLVASTAVLSDRDRSAGAGRVDGAQARPPARRGGRGGDHQGGDRQGAARDTLPRPRRRGSTRRSWRRTSATPRTRRSRWTARGRWRARARKVAAIVDGHAVRVRDRSRSLGRTVRGDVARRLRAAPARPRRR